MSEAILGGTTAFDSSVSVWEKIGTVSNTSSPLSVAIPDSASSYALLYAICSLNTTYSPTYDATREAAIFTSNVTGTIYTFVYQGWGQTVFEPFSYVSPVISRATRSSGTVFVFANTQWAVGATSFFGIRALVNSWSLCGGSVGQVSATFYGIKASS